MRDLETVLASPEALSDALDDALSARATPAAVSINHGLRTAQDINDYARSGPRSHVSEADIRRSDD